MRFPPPTSCTLLLKVLYPVVWLVNGLANLVLKPFRVHTNVELMEHLNREELRTLVKEGGKQIPDDHQRMLVNILDLEQATIEDVMIPRQDIVGIDLDDDWDEILLQLTQTVYTRMPVYRDSIDQVEGLLHIRTVIAKLAHGELTYEDLKRSVRRPYFIPEGTALTQQLLEFQRRERRMGLVVDEYGDIQGLVTLDDILEEIVGEYTPESRARIARDPPAGRRQLPGGRRRSAAHAEPHAGLGPARRRGQHAERPAAGGTGGNPHRQGKPENRPAHHDHPRDQGKRHRQGADQTQLGAGTSLSDLWLAQIAFSSASATCCNGTTSQPLDRLARRVRGRNQGPLEAVSGGFPQALLTVMHRADFARQSDFAETDHAVGRRAVAKTGKQRQQHRQIGPGLGDAHAPHHVDEHIVIGQRNPAVAMQHRQHHGQAVVLQPQRNPPRVVQVAEVDQRLHFQQDGPGAFAHHGDDAARNRLLDARTERWPRDS